MPWCGSRAWWYDGVLPADHHHRRRVGGGRDDAGERVGQARRQVDVEDGELVRHAEVRVGGVRRLLLVPERHVLDAELVAGVDQRVVGVAALAEDLGTPSCCRHSAMNIAPVISRLPRVAIRRSGGGRTVPAGWPPGRGRRGLATRSVVNPLVSYVTVSAGVKRGIVAAPAAPGGGHSPGLERPGTTRLRCPSRAATRCATRAGGDLRPSGLRPGNVDTDTQRGRTGGALMVGGGHITERARMIVSRDLRLGPVNRASRRSAVRSLLAIRLIQGGPQPSGQLPRVIVRPEMHVEEPRGILEAVVVHRRHVDAVLPQGPGDRIHLLVDQDEVSRDRRLARPRSAGSSSPSSRPLPATGACPICGDGLGARHRDLKHAGADVPPRPAEHLLDPLRVERRPARGGGPPRRRRAASRWRTTPGAAPSPAGPPRRVLRSACT